MSYFIWIRRRSFCSVEIGILSEMVSTCLAVDAAPVAGDGEHVVGTCCLFFFITTLFLFFFFLLHIITLRGRLYYENCLVI